jgi:hypothetical protein
VLPSRWHIQEHKRVLYLKAGETVSGSNDGTERAVCADNGQHVASVSSHYTQQGRSMSLQLRFSSVHLTH